MYKIDRTKGMYLLLTQKVNPKMPIRWDSHALQEKMEFVF